MKYIISVDGGGTKTEAVVCDMLGNVVNRAFAGSSNPNDIGKENMLNVIDGLIEKIIPSDCDVADIGLGISGIFVANGEEYLRMHLKEKFVFLDAVNVYSDKDSAMFSAYENDGCIMIIGTGSIGLVKKDDEIINLGGGGYLIDDALSGFDLGREILNAVLCDNDGICEKTILSKLVYEKTGEDIRKHLKIVYQKGKAYVASFSPLIFDALKEGDEVAKRIMQKCVAGFERLALAIYKAWGKDSCEITLFGGLSNHLGIIKDYLSNNTKKIISFKQSNIPIIYGPIRKIKGESEFIANFLKTY